MNIEEKLQKFVELCGDWNYRNIDMTKPHLQSINIKDNRIETSCELFSVELDDYVSCESGIFENKELANKFKSLNINDKECVIDFMNSIENLIDWDKVRADLTKEENHDNRKVIVLDTWVTDYDDIRCRAILLEDSKAIANIVASYDEVDIRYAGSKNGYDIELTDDYIKDSFKILIKEDFDSYLKLPKISECSKLLQEIYDEVCGMETTKFCITKEDWKEYYSERYNNQDFQKLEKEIIKYRLQEIIETGTQFNIYASSNLETEFNDDLNLKQYDMQFEESNIDLEI